MNIDFRKLPEFDNHELVVSRQDKNLSAFIAIHSSKLGPAAGGTRYWLYHDAKLALVDALKLSQAMTYKCALAGVPHGGGKGVIIGDPKKIKPKILIAEYAAMVNDLRGKFFTGEDVGLNQNDVESLARKSPYIIGTEKKAGDPAPWAALGVYYSIKAALKSALGSDSLHGRTIAVKGLGKVGSELIRLGLAEGAEVFGADINPQAASNLSKKFPKVKIVDNDEIHKLAVDILSPCDLGDLFDMKSIKQLKCRIICGGANNQLANKQCGEFLHKIGILYVPDYVANAGGLINVVAELERGGYDRLKVTNKVKAIGHTVSKIINLSNKQHQATSTVADQLAHEIIKTKAHVGVKA